MQNILQDAVDPETQFQHMVFRLQMDIRSAHLQRGAKNAFHKIRGAFAGLPGFVLKPCEFGYKIPLPANPHYFILCGLWL